MTEAASLCLTDWVGAAIRGSTEPLAAALEAVVTASGGEPQATIIGRGRRTSALLAALANGAQGHALDFDDTHLASIVHGSAPVAPAALAIAEWCGRSGAAVVEAFVAGFEVETRIGRVIGPLTTDQHIEMRERGQVQGYHEVSRDRTTWQALDLVPQLRPAPPSPPPAYHEPREQERGRDRAAPARRSPWANRQYQFIVGGVVLLLVAGTVAAVVLSRKPGGSGGGGGSGW